MMVCLRAKSEIVSNGEKVTRIAQITGQAKSQAYGSILRYSSPKRCATPSWSWGLLHYRCESAKGIILIRNFIVSSAAFCALALLFAVFALPVTAADLLLFPSITSVHQSKEDTELAAKKFVPAVDIFYATEFSQTRFLAEYLASSREKELERLQVGWHILPGKSLWVGRFHNAISFWNTQMHHGDFLQSSLSRPTVANYEDEHGPLPAHISGFLFESSRTAGDSEINYMAGLGIGPIFDVTLQPLDLLDPSKPGKIAASFRLGYHPEVGNPDQFGAALGYARIPVKNVSQFDEVRQTVFSTFLNVEQNKFHLIGELFVFDDRVSGAANTSRYTTVSAYLQPEYKLGESGRTTVYGRVESTPRAAQDGYLALLPEFSSHQLVAGLRFDITPSQAIKVETVRSHRHDGLEINSISAQWSMVLPL
jgi:hypothetical protein